jgi:hypothetical protein
MSLQGWVDQICGIGLGSLDPGSDVDVIDRTLRESVRCEAEKNCGGYEKKPENKSAPTSTQFVPSKDPVKVQVAIAVCNQAARAFVPVIAAHSYLIKADRTTALTRRRQPFFSAMQLFPTLEQALAGSPTAYSDLIMLAETKL